MPVTQTPDRPSPKSERWRARTVVPSRIYLRLLSGKILVGDPLFYPAGDGTPLGCGPAPRLCHIVGVKSLVEPSHTLTIQVQSIGIQANARLRKLVADLTPDKEMLSEVIKKALTAARGREMIDFVRTSKSRSDEPAVRCLPAAAPVTTARCATTKPFCASASVRSLRREHAMDTGASISSCGARVGAST